jgi:hypothetical protein
MMPSIPNSAQQPLRLQIMTLRIIVVALAMGVIVFGTYVVARNIGKPHFLAEKLDTVSLVLLGMGLATLLLGIVVPSLFFANRRGSPLTPAALATYDREAAKVFGILGRLQTATIIGCALFEAGAFANLYGYMETRELLHLGIASVLTMGILARFPFELSTVQRIEEELRRLKEEEGLRGQP